MDKSTLSNFGWGIVILVVLALLITFATPAGRGLMDKYFQGVDVLKNMAEDVNPNDAMLSSHTISAAYGYEDIIQFNKTEGDKGDLIEVSSDVTPLMEVTGLKLVYNGREVILNKPNFKMVNANVTVTPIWNTFEYVKVFFTDYQDALVTAIAVNDDSFNDRLVVEYEGVTYYVVHDRSPVLGKGNDGSSLYSNLDSVSKVVFGQNHISIMAGCFSNCQNLTDVVLNAGIMNIGDSAFYNCTSLTGSLTFYKGLKTIGMSAFENTDITSINFNSDLQKISANAFAGCLNLFAYNCGSIYENTVVEFGAFTDEYFTAIDPNAPEDGGSGDIGNDGQDENNATTEPPLEDDEEELTTDPEDEFIEPPTEPDDVTVSPDEV